MTSPPQRIDVAECLRKGMIGALGAIPGTAAAHPFDVVKIRMQTSGDRLSTAVAHVARNQGSGGPRSFYRGLTSALQQRVLTRGPMFLFSELFTRAAMRHGGLDRGTACFVGSAGSGYATGAVAAIAEYRKVLTSQGVPVRSISGNGHSKGGGETRAWRYADITRHWRSHGRQLLKRAHGAGTRNAIFDSTFFGLQHMLSERHGVSPGASYALAAGTAVAVDYSVDMSLKRMMVVPPDERVGGLIRTLSGFVADGRARGRSLLATVLLVHRGLSAKVVEFSVNYGVMGVASVYVYAAAARLFGPASVT